MKLLAASLLAAIAGSLVLLWTSSLYDPTAQWGYEHGREWFIERARQSAPGADVDVQGWTPVVTGYYGRRLAFYAKHHPEDRLIRLSPVAGARVDFLAPGGADAVAFQFAANGELLGWNHLRPAGEVQPLPADAAYRLAYTTYVYLAGPDAKFYHMASQGAESPQGQVFSWEREEQGAAALKQVCTVVIRGSKVTRGEWSSDLNREAAAEYDRSSGTNYVSIVYVSFLLLILPAALFRYIGLSSRGRAHQRFAIAFGVTGLVTLALSMWFGGQYSLLQHGVVVAMVSGQSSNAEVYSMVWELMLTSVGLFAVAGAGSGHGMAGAECWRTARMLFTGRAFRKPVGEALLTGMLWAPLMAAIPFLLAGTTLFGDPHLPISGSDSILSPSPLLSIVNRADVINILVVFGLLVPFLEKQLPRWRLGMILGITLGTTFFAGSLDRGTRPISFALAVGAAQFALGYFLYRRWDLLTLMSTWFAVAAIGEILMFADQHQGDMHTEAVRLSLWLMGAMCVAFVMVWKGNPAELEVEAPAPSGTQELESERELLMAEFSVAHRAQQEMLPNSPPNLPGFSLAASCTPARDVGGDLFDFLPLKDGRWGISVADVSGKGVPAALYMTLTKGLLVATTQDSTDMLRIMDQVNTHVHAASRRKIFVTMAMGFLDAESRTMEYVRAGHNPIVWRQTGRNETRLVTPGGMGLGITSGKIFQRALRLERMQIAPGDAVVFYSDGLTEAMNEHQEQFGEERLMASVDETDGMDAQSTHDYVLQSVKAFLNGCHPQDDLTLVVLRAAEAS